MIKLPSLNAPIIIGNSSAGTSVTLTNATYDYDFDVPDSEIVKSVINGARQILNGAGNYFSGEIDVFQLTYSSYSTLKAMQGTTVRLWFFGTGQVPDTSPQKYYPYCDVIVSSVRPYHRNKKYYYDAAIVRVESANYYTLDYAVTNGLVGGS